MEDEGIVSSSVEDKVRGMDEVSRSVARRASWRGERGVWGREGIWLRGLLEDEEEREEWSIGQAARPVSRLGVEAEGTCMGHSAGGLMAGAGGGVCMGHSGGGREEEDVEVEGWLVGRPGDEGKIGRK